MALLFYIVVILTNIVLIFLKWSSSGAFSELILKILGKLIPLFLIFVSLIQILYMFDFILKPFF